MKRTKAATYFPTPAGGSIIGPKELNFRVRNGAGCFLSGIATQIRTSIYHGDKKLSIHIETDLRFSAASLQFGE